METIQASELSEMMLGNLNEFMNICSRWFMTADTPHLRLTATYPIDQVPEEAEDLLDSDDRSDFLIDIPDYGSGHIVCVTT